MRQAVLVAPKHIEFKEVAAPKAEDLKEHQILVNIKRIGICGSEIHSRTPSRYVLPRSSGS